MAFCRCDASVCDQSVKFRLNFSKQEMLPSLFPRISESSHLLFPDLRRSDPEGPHDGGPVGEGNLNPQDDQRL